MSTYVADALATATLVAMEHGLLADEIAGMGRSSDGGQHELRLTVSELGARRPGQKHEEDGMPQFMDVHDGFYGVTQEQVEAAHRRDLAIEAGEGVHFQQWWADPTTGKVFCLSDGPSKEAVYRVHEKAGHPTDQIWEVSLSGT